MLNIDIVMRDFCEAGAKAVERYEAISGEEPRRMPEYFMPAYIANYIGDSITSTLETNFSTLNIWNKSTRDRMGLPIRQLTDIELQETEILRIRRVDMCLFEGREDGKPQDKEDIYALVEFKGGWIDSQEFLGRTSDRIKIIKLLESIDTCRWGVICGWVNEDNYRFQISNNTTDKWFEHPIRLQLSPNIALRFCARVFHRNDVLTTP